MEMVKLLAEREETPQKIMINNEVCIYNTATDEREFINKYYISFENERTNSNTSMSFEKALKRAKKYRSQRLWICRQVVKYEIVMQRKLKILS